jgi:hypothetical protein
VILLKSQVAEAFFAGTGVLSAEMILLEWLVIEGGFACTSGLSAEIAQDRYHEILESLATINPADGSRGHLRFLDTGLNLAASNLFRIGFKFGGAVRIKNATITTTLGTYTLGVATNWTLVKYFTSHDLTITSDGIGRSGRRHSLASATTRADLCPDIRDGARPRARTSE